MGVIKTTLQSRTVFILNLSLRLANTIIPGIPPSIGIAGSALFTSILRNNL